MRSSEQLRNHYEVEKGLATRLREAPRGERAQLYGRVYDELFRRVPDHPQLTRKSDDSSQQAAVAERMHLLEYFLGPETVFLEIGAGDGSLSRQVSARVKRCLALDVSKEILDTAMEGNMQPVLSDGCSIPVPAGSITLAYSYQLMEHIHPDDAIEQLRNIYTALAVGGTYLCVTPNRLNGPHDISQYFDDTARGLHLKEYTLIELAGVFRTVGFRRVVPYVGLSHRYWRVPLWMLVAFEKVMGWLPHALRRSIGSWRGVQNLLFISVAAIK